jgi:GT2 family glycosyltransferase
VSVPSVFVVVVNWNGAEDTVQCLESLRAQSLRPLRLVLVDNGSEDDSAGRIAAWSAAHATEVTSIWYDRRAAEAGGREADESRLAQADDVQLAVVEVGENLGFAGGSNVGLRYAMKAGAEHVLLLNNDTVVERDALTRLLAFLLEHPDYMAVTGQIRYWGRPVIWNCGGDLTWFGSRRYLYAGQPVASAPQQGWRTITFITGCAALVRASVFKRLGLLTERFFFGEEDYEFSLRLRDARCRIACSFDAVIHHKVGSSIDRTAPAGALGRYYIYYLNRFIDMRDHYPRPVWTVWRWFTLAFVLPRLWRSRRVSWRGMGLLGSRLLRDSGTLDGVTRERFEWASRTGLE